MGKQARRPDRMARLRIILTMMLVLAANINTSNSKMREDRPKRHKEVWSKEGVHGKAGLSHPEAHTKGPVSQLEINSKFSSPKTHEKLPRLHSEQLEQPGKGLSVKECPPYCYCRLRSEGNETILEVKNCVYDPIDALPKLFDSLPHNITQMRLINCQLTRLPLEIIKHALSVVDLSMNKFTELPRELLQLPWLEELDISCNNVSSLPELPQGMTAMRNLRWLNLTKNELESLPQSIGALSLLESLDLIHNKLNSLPAEIGNLTQVLRLLLSDNYIETLPAEIGNLTRLEELYLYDNHIRTLPAEIGNLTQLQLLFLSNNHIKNLPAEIGKLTKLQFLHLSYNHIQTLPAEIGNLTHLLGLHLSDNHIEILPAEIGNLAHLQWLVLYDNHIKTLPAEIGNLTNLMELNLSNNQLRSVPCEIGRLTSLYSLDLHSNEIIMLPSEITELKQLQILYLGSNPLIKIPTLPTESLDTVGFDNCSIQTLPCELLTEGYISSLQLGHNAIKTIDCSDCNSHLEYLNLDHNYLQEIPCTPYLLNIKMISAIYNNISALPNCFISDLITGIFNHNMLDSLDFNLFCSGIPSRSIQYIGFAQNRISTIYTMYSPLNQCFKPGALIDLQYNMLTALDSWPMLLSADRNITIDVSFNKLSKFTNSAGTFIYSFHQYGTVFRMQGNQIKNFMDVFDGWNVIVNTTEHLNTLLMNAYFDLGYNPLVCDCVDYEVYRHIQTHPTEQYNNLMCQKPLSLKGQNPKHIPLEDFVCDVDSKCPDACTCIIVPHSQTVNVTCQGYNQTNMPKVVPDLPKQNYEYRIDICHQHLHEITSRPYLHKATEIRLSNNSIIAIKVNSSNDFNRVKILHLENNLLQRLPESVAGMTNGTVVEVIRLGSNPWVCDCKALDMKNWIMRNWHIVKDKDVILCHSPHSMVGVKVIDIERSMVCPNENKTIVYVVAVISSVVFISIVFVYIYDKLKYANWRFIGSDECDGEFKEFDVFMCAAVADSEYVEEYLIPELERRDFRVLYHLEHFDGGKPIHVNMYEAFEKSKRTLVFFSNNFKDSRYSMFEFHSAYDLDIRKNTRRLITIKDTDLDMSKLDIFEACYFEKYTYIERESVRFWKLLEHSLPRKRLGGNVRLR